MPASRRSGAQAIVSTRQLDKPSIVGPFCKSSGSGYAWQPPPRRGARHSGPLGATIEA